MNGPATTWWLWRTAWRGELGLRAATALAALVLAAALAAAPQFAEAMRELALSTALATRPAAQPDLRLTLAGVPLDGRPYQSAAEDLDRAARDALGESPVDQLRTITTDSLLIAAPSGARPDEQAAPAPRAVLRARAGLETRVSYRAGQRVPGITGLPELVQVAVASETAAHRGLSVGRRLVLHPSWNVDAAPVTVEIAAIIDPADAGDAYWQGDAALALDGPSAAEAPLVLHVPEATLFGALAALLPDAAATLESTYRLGTAPTPATAEPMRAQLGSLAARLAAADRPAAVDTPLAPVLARYARSHRFTTGTTLLVAVQLAALAAFAVRTLAHEAARRRAPAVALLTARGVDPGTLHAVHALEATLLALPALALGPVLGGLAIAALGRTAPFEALTGGELLSPSLGGTAWALAGAGTAIAWLALAVPPRSAELARASAPRRGWSRSVALAALSVAAFAWLDATRGPLVAIESGRPELRLDQLAVPIVTIAAVVSLGAAAAWLVRRALPAASALRTLSALAGPAAAGAALVAAAVALAFAAALAAPSLSRAAAAAPAFAAGAEVRAGSDAPDAPLPAAASARSPVLRTSARIDASGPAIPRDGGLALRVLGVDPATLGAATDPAPALGGASLDAVLTALATNAAAAEEPPLLTGARFVGAWMQLPGLRDATTVGVQLRTRAGALVDVPLTTVLPGQIPVSEWSFFAAEVPPAARESTLAAVTLTVHGGAGGTLLLGPVVATGAQTVATRGGGGRVPFTGGVVVDEFVDASRWEPLTDADGLPGGVLAAAGEAPPGATAATRLDWRASAAAEGTARHGLRPGDGAPVLLYLDRTSAGVLGLEAGAAASLELNGHRVRAQVAGLLDAFPGLADPTGTAPQPPGFAIAELSRLRAASVATPATGSATANETWYATSDADALRHELAGAGVPIITDRAAAAATLQPTTVTPAGWAGLLLLAARAATVLAALVLLASGANASTTTRIAALAAGTALGLAAGAALHPWVLHAVAWSGAAEPLAPAPVAAIEWTPVVATVALLAIAAVARAIAVPLARLAQPRRAAPVP